MPRTVPLSLRRRLLLYPILGALLLNLTGCLVFESLIKLKPDGSGTIEQSFIITSEMLRMALMFGGEDGGPAELCDEDELTEEAAAMGEGVRLLDAEAVNDGEAVGCRARFAFDDINTLTFSLNPEGQMPGGLSPDDPDAEAPGDAEDRISFRFDPGNPATLVVHMNQDDHFDPPEAPEETPPADSTQRAMQMQMMREVFKGTRLSVALEIEGTLVETDASFRDGNRIALLDVDFDQLLENEDYLARIAEANPQSADEMRALMEEVDGIRVETQETVTVRMR